MLQLAMTRVIKVVFFKIFSEDMANLITFIMLHISHYTHTQYKIRKINSFIVNF